MKTEIFELNDGRVLGMRAFEVMSLPSNESYEKSKEESCERISQVFSKLLNELHKLCTENTCVEFLWSTEKAYHQTFSSKIRIFCILREIGKDRSVIKINLDSVQINLLSTISLLQYSTYESDNSITQVKTVLKGVNEECVFGIVKAEKCVVNASSPYPYYYPEIIPGDNLENFDSLIATLSQQENCCVSFQIFPTNFTSEELYLINEMSSELGRLSGGMFANGQMYKDIAALEPQKVYSYYNERNRSALFKYNILIFGGRRSCASLATKIISLLQSGENKVFLPEFKCIDLSNEKIRLESQFPYYVWNINNRLLYYYRNNQLLNRVVLAKKLYRIAYVITADEAVAFFRLPLYEDTMTALQGNQIGSIKEQFLNEVVDENNIRFGELVSNSFSKILLGCSEKAFTKHALIVGTPGSGKTTFSINLLLQFARRGIPFLAIEPTKTEYRALIDAIPKLQIFTPGNNAVSPYIINPFIPPKGIRIEQYIPSLASAFKAAFSMPSPLDMFFLKAIRACYIQYGWKDYSKLGDKDVKLFGLHEFILVFKRLIANTNYSKEVRGNIESAGLLRLTNLIEQNSNIYDTVNTVSIEDLLTAPTILELNAIDNAEQKALIMALLLISICVYTKNNHVGDGELKNAILIDEAHVLLGNVPVSNHGEVNSQNTTVKALQDMIAEIRSYGTSIIIADQSPTKVSREIIANTDIKVSFRLVQQVEKQLISDSTGMNSGMENKLSRLKPGEAYVYYSKLDLPQMIKTQDIREMENIRLSVSDTEVMTKNTYWKENRKLLIPYTECKYCQLCAETCDFNVRSDAEYIANRAFQRYLSELKTVDAFKKCIFYLPVLMEKEYLKYKAEQLERIQICSRIKLFRKIVLELPLVMSEADKERMIISFPQKNI